MLSVLLAVGFAWQDPFAVAFSARFYEPPTSPRASHTQLYTCALDGSHRKQWTHGDLDVGSVRWQDRNHVVFAKTLMGLESTTYEYFVLDLQKGRTRALKGAEFERAESAAQENRLFDQFQEPEEPQTVSVPFRQHHMKVRMGDDDDYATVLNPDGHEIKVPSMESEHGDYHGYTIGGGKLWALSWTHNSTENSIYGIYCFDPAKAVFRLKTPFCNDIDFSPNRDLYVGVTVRGLSAYNTQKKVWTAQVIVGSLRTGQSRRVGKGLEYATCAQLRPGLRSSPP